MSSVTAPPQRPSAPSEGEPAAPPPPGPGDASPLIEPEPRRPGRLRWMLLGCVIVMLTSAGASAVFVLGQVHNLVGAVSQNKSLNVAPGELANAGFGGPQTLLLVGNDQRAHTTTAPVLPHSNEMLLVRIDPGKPWISMMSVPRELLTTIQCPNGTTTTRFNYALTCGGFSTLVSTIKHVTGLSVNHVVMIDFNNFKTAVNSLGCVYSTVDRRYFHVNTPTSQQYQEINLQPGYQNMCGTQALQFVSYRHGDTSLVRDARDQSFLLSVKQQFGPTLVDNVGRFERIFGRLVTTDQSLHTTTGVLDLLGTLISASGKPVRQVQFQADLNPTNAAATACACVTATPGQIAASVHSFLYGALRLHAKSTAKVARAVHRRKVLARLPLTASSSSELAQATAAAGQLPFPLEYPRVQDTGGTGIRVSLREYEIHAPGGAAYPIYVTVFSNGLLGQYYDVQGTTWTTPPLLDSPGQSVRLGSRTYYLYYTGQHLQVVAWYEHHAVYWVHNTLLDSIGNGELLAIAEQTSPLGSDHPGATRRIHLSSVTAPPNPTSDAAPQSLTQRILSLGGLIALAAIPLLGLASFKRRREHADLRTRLETRAARIRELTAALTPATVNVPEAVLTSRATMPITVYGRQRSSLRWLAIAATGLVVVVVGVAGVALRGDLMNTSARIAARAPRRHAPLMEPTVPVAVLNASRAQGAAAHLAQRLRTMKIDVSQIGNVATSGPNRMSILYVPGAQRQAASLARLLAAKAGAQPTIAPINPVTQAAGGRTAKLAVVIG